MTAIADKRETVLPEGSLPNGGGHHWRPLLIHNGRLWTSIGDPGNITDATDSTIPKEKKYGRSLSTEKIKNFGAPEFEIRKSL